MKTKRLNLWGMLFAGMFFGLAALSHAQPTISGVNAFWYLGGPTDDGAGCPNGWCYYAQSTWTANSDGHAGTPTWTVEYAGTGRVSLSCYTCTSTLATATDFSAGCNYDIEVYVTYPDGAQSNLFFVLINTAAGSTLQSGYPMNSDWIFSAGDTGYQSVYQWTVNDLCGNVLSGTDANETFGSVTYPYPGADWPLPQANPIYVPQGYSYDDVLGASGSAAGGWIPVPQFVGNGSTLVETDSPWNYYLWSQRSGVGVSMHRDTQQWWQDHGTHSVPSQPDLNE